MKKKRMAMIEPIHNCEKTLEGALAAEPEPDSPTLSLDIDCRHEAWHGLETSLAAQAAHVWRHLDLPPAEISLVLADSTFIATLNEAYRDKKGATNVLSFPAQDFTAPVTRNGLTAVPQPRLLGDIVLAHDVLAVEAQAQGKLMEDHMLHLLTHGLLHLLGYDHIDDGAAQLMEQLEKDILAAQGRPDPYLFDGDEKAADR